VAATARLNLKDYLEVHKRADKRKVRLQFNFIIGIVISAANSVLLIV